MKKVLHKVLFAAALVTAAAGTAQIASTVISSATTFDPAAKNYPTAPGEITDLQVLANGEFPKSGTIWFILPYALSNGDSPTGTTLSYSIEINGETIVDNKAADYGDVITYDISTSQRGEMFTITVWCTNENGSSPKVTIQKFLGEDTPAPVSDFKAEFNEETLNISWAPTHGILNGEYNEGWVTYYVYINPGNIKIGPLSYNQSEVSHTFEGEIPPAAYRASIDMEYLDPITSTITSYPTVYSDFIIKPIEAPFTFNLAEDPDAAKASFLTYNMDEDTQGWEFSSNGAAISWDGSEPKDDWLITMPIEMKAGGVYTATVKLQANGWEEKAEIFTGEGPEPKDMTENVFPKQAFSDSQTATFEFTANRDIIRYIGIHACSDRDKLYLYVPEISVEQTGTCEAFSYDHNLTAGQLTIPDAAAGTNLEIDFKVTNNGFETTGGYTAKLYVNNEPVDQKPGHELQSGESEVIKFDFKSSILHDETLTIYAEIVYEEDEAPIDNISDIYFVDLSQPTHPTITDLDTTSEGNTVTLTWSAPNVEGSGYEEIVESWEDYPTFSIGLPTSELENDSLGEWTVIDVDGKACVKPSGVKDEFPNYCGNYNGASSAYRTSPRAWTVMDATEVGYKPNTGWNANPVLNANTGTKCLIAIRAYTGMSNDWLISPELTGKAQTISFKAMSMENANGVYFNMYYSTTGKEIDDFILVDSSDNEPMYNSEGTYSDFSFEVPAGAKYFAIQSECMSGASLAIDDVCFRKASTKNQLEVHGYNVFRNKVQLNNELVVEPTYVDTDVEAGTHQYHVSTVFNQGESALSNPSSIYIDTTGVESVTTDGVTVTANNGTITISGADGQPITIYTLDGKLVVASPAVSSAEYNVGPGIYIVRTGETTVKVIAY